MSKANKRTRYITSPFVKHLDNEGKQRKVLDYVVNMCATISSFYVGTGGLDIELINSAQGIAGGENWEKKLLHIPNPYTRQLSRSWRR